MAEYGDETIVVVEIDQPFCTRQYGDAFVSPTGGCTAQLGSTGNRKCYNSRDTCQDTDNYNPGILTLRFVRSRAGGLQYGNVFPCIEDIDVTPGSLNLGGMDQGASVLGKREVVNLTMSDFRHSDHLVDKYRLERLTGDAAVSELFNPYERGTFWGKWLARNPYYNNYALRVYDGVVGDAIADMRVRHYIIDRIDGPSNGQVKIVAKDLFSKIERRKAVAPKASRGELAANIAASGVVSFDLSPAGIGNEDYPASGHVAIGDEIIQFTRSGDTMTVVTRGALGTTAESHEDEDLVQVVLSYTSQQAQNIVFDLLCNYTPLGNEGSPTGSSYIDKAEWDTAASSLANLYSAHIAVPTPVQDLIGELAEQVGFTVWYDPDTGMVEFKVLRISASSAEIDDDTWIIDGSLSITRKPEKRASQVWVYYGQKNPLEDITEENNFHSRYVDPDLDAEDEHQYGAPAIRKVYSRWISQFGRSVAAGVSDRLLAMFRDPPIEAKFSITSDHADEVSLAGYITLQTADVQDVTGSDDEVQHAVVEVEHSEDEIRLKTQSVVLLQENDEREVFIETDNNNINLRTLHDALYAPPVGGSPTGENVRFVIEEEVFIGSTSTSSPAVTTGSWPAGVVLTLVNRGRIQGKGGAGGAGGNGFSGLNGVLNLVTSSAGANGLPGGPAFEALHSITVDNSSGHIWGGGGGGGGGGGCGMIADTDPPGGSRAWTAAGGSGGGAGRGNTASAGGSAGTGSSNQPDSFQQTINGNNGNVSTTEAPGTGGTSNSAEEIQGGNQSGARSTGGAGATGGTPGAAGATGGTGVNTLLFGTTDEESASAGGSGGAAGAAVVGSSLVTFGSPTGDILGALT